MTQIVSSISGIEIYAPSAGNAPTNSADVSAIASAYQVVSATGTQLYAGTAHVTSINSAPISASRAGNAANASMANSAYYDGTGRLISSLPDSATVSAIASGYAVNKADASALSSYALSADVSGVIDTVSSNSASWKSGGVVTSTGSGWFGGGGGIGITSINGSALSAQEAGSASRASDDDYGYNIRLNYAKQSAFSGVSATVANNSASWGQGGVDSATVSSIASSYAQSAVSGVESTVSANSATWGGGGGGSVELSANTENGVRWVSYTNFGSSYYSANADTSRRSMVLYKSYGGPVSVVFGLSGEPWVASSIGYYDTAVSIPDASAALLTAIWFSNTSYSFTATSIVDGAQLQSISAINVLGSSASISDGVLKLKEVYVNTDISKAGGLTGNGTPGSPYGWPSVLYNTTGGAFIDCANSVLYFPNIYNGKTANFTGDVSASGVSVTGLSAAVSAKQDTLTFGYDGTAISSIDGSALAGGGGGGIDSATCSAIASSYAESAVSGKADSSALSSYALSADVSGTVDLVSTQSANWGGSALALSAGAGVKLEKVGNTLVASTDETVLWSGSALITAVTSYPASETPTNFNKIEIYGESWNGWVPVKWAEIWPEKTGENSISTNYLGGGGGAIRFAQMFVTTYNSGFTIANTKLFSLTGTGVVTGTPDHTVVRKIVGINRTAGV